MGPLPAAGSAWRGTSESNIGCLLSKAGRAIGDATRASLLKAYIAICAPLEAWDEAANTYPVRTSSAELVRVPALGVRFGKVVSGF